MARYLTNRLWQSFLQLNLFSKPTSNSQTTAKERLATRIYICAIFICLLTIAIVAGSIVRNVEKTETSPSYRQFLRLIKKYPNTLYCPCSNFDITYKTFVTTHVRFHQVCSSSFIDQRWIDFIFTNDNISFSSIDDYRVTLSFFWQIIAGLCVASQKTWTDAENNFQTKHLLTPMAVADEVIQSAVDADLNNQIAVSQASMTRNLLAIRRMTSGNQLVSGLQTNYHLRFPPDNFGTWNSPRMSPRMFNNCSCLNIEGCPRLATFKNDQNHSIQIPGMIADCLVIDGVLASTLECYYNQSCLSLLHDSLPEDIQPLSQRLDTDFSANFTVQTLLNKLMIDQMTSEIRFDVFYTQCNPAYCSYSYTRRFDVLFVVTTVIGIFGTLSMILRWTLPLIIEGIFRWKHRNLTNNDTTGASSPRRNYLRTIWSHVRQVITTLNLFESETLGTPIQIHREQLLTRFFIILIILSSIAVGLYIFLVEQNQVVTIEHPSLATYHQLYNDHPNTLKCPCSQISLPYNVFLNVTFVLHQVCQSDLVSKEWLEYLTSFDPTLLPSSTYTAYSRDFRTIGASYFQLLSTFCSLVRINIEDAQRVFTNTLLVNDHVIPPTLFRQQTEVIIQSFIDRTRNEFIQIFRWINIAFVSSQFFNGANVKPDITVTDDRQISLVSSVLWRLTSVSDESMGFNGVCTCEFDLLIGCKIVPELYTNGSALNKSQQFLFFRILEIGCMPLIGFTDSQISWWYNATYFDYIRATYSMVIDSQPPVRVMALNSSETTQFNDVVTIDLINRMMLETTTTNNTYFEQFYSACEPSACTYTIIRHRDLIVLVFLLIAICSGLKEGLEILIPSIGKLIFFGIDQCKNRDIRQEQPSVNIRLKNLASSAVHSIKTLNLFQTRETGVDEQKIYTRIYLVLLVSSLSIILFYTATVERTITKTHWLPTVEDYEQLVQLYSHNLICPCTQLSVPYGEFITELQVDAFHHACAKDMISHILMSGTIISPGQQIGSGNYFTSWIPLFIVSITNLCVLSNETIDNGISTLRSSTKFLKQLITRAEFNREMNETLDQFEKEIPIAFTRTLDLIRTSSQGNALMSLYTRNWAFVIDEKDEGENISFLNVPVIRYDEEQNITCSCATLRTCATPVKVSIFDDLTILDGFVFGCSLLETVLLSSLSCLYSDTCINNVRLMVGGDYVLPEFSVRLNAPSTRFSINDTIETMAREMFIESWMHEVSYERFFNSCAPSHCTFIYRYRFDVLELVTTFLSVFAGLSLGLRFAVPLLARIGKQIRNRLRVAPLQ